MSQQIIRRGLTWFVRLSLPRDRWADVGRAMSAGGGLKREVVRTLQTSDRAEALRRRDVALAAVRREVDAALAAARLRPLTDWTADWPSAAADWRQRLATASSAVIHEETDELGTNQTTERDVVAEGASDALDVLSERRGPEAARMFRAITLGETMTVAEAARQWIAETEAGRRQQTIKGHRAVLVGFGNFLQETQGWPSLAGITLAQITRRIAGEFIASRGTTVAPATVKREASTLTGLWRWALRRGYAEATPWADQTADLGRRVAHRRDTDGRKRAFTDMELATLLRAADKLAPNGGGYGAALWDAIRLGLLTGLRAGELLALTVADVGDGSAVVVRGGKTANAARTVPVHGLGSQVIADRLAGLLDRSPSAPLWPEVPPGGADGRRSKLLCSRFVTARRRILGPSAEVDFHSLRRSFATSLETAMHGGGKINPALIASLMGHTRGSMALDLYSSGPRAAPLRDAIDDMVAHGWPKVVLEAWQDTAEQRPRMVRTVPAYRKPVQATKSRRAVQQSSPP